MKSTAEYRRIYLNAKALMLLRGQRLESAFIGRRQDGASSFQEIISQFHAIPQLFFLPSAPYLLRSGGRYRLKEKIFAFSAQASIICDYRGLQQRPP
jgi:hypothetical protein